MRSREREESVEDATLRLVLEHAAELLRFARRFTHCADDAHDAYQRALEILVRRMRSDPPAQPLPWLRTVIRHEAFAIRGERERLLGGAEIDLDRHADRTAADPAEQAVGLERLRHTAEALRRLKPQEASALVMRAEGLSYAEICQRTGWTYTKTNRAITEGRRALLQRLGAIESGAECARWLPRLSALADGEASAQDLADLRPHLRACPACRATLRACHDAPAQVALLIPPAAVAVAPGAAHGSAIEHVHVFFHALAERATLMAARLQGAIETVPTTKVAAVAASTAALAGGGVAIQHATHAAPAVGRAADVPVAQGSVAPSLAPGTLRLPRRPTRSRATARSPRRGGAEFAGSASREFARTPNAHSASVPRPAPRAEFTASSPPPAPAAAVATSPPAEFGGP